MWIDSRPSYSHSHVCCTRAWCLYSKYKRLSFGRFPTPLFFLLLSLSLSSPDAGKTKLLYKLSLHVWNGEEHGPTWGECCLMCWQCRQLFLSSAKVQTDYLGQYKESSVTRFPLLRDMTGFFWCLIQWHLCDSLLLVEVKVWKEMNQFLCSCLAGTILKQLIMGT